MFVAGKSLDQQVLNTNEKFFLNVKAYMPITADFGAQLKCLSHKPIETIRSEVFFRYNKHSIKTSLLIVIFNEFLK